MLAMLLPANAVLPHWNEWLMGRCTKLVYYQGGLYLLVQELMEDNQVISSGSRAEQGVI